MNKTSAKEWLEKVWHNYGAAKILFDANHYTDVVAVELHYAIEKTFKSLLAAENKRIPRTHNLDELYSIIKEKIQLDDTEMELLNIVSEYHIEESYPSINKSLPVRNEIKEVMDFTHELFSRVCRILDVDIQEVMK